MLRWRIRLYLRPGPGYANLLELAVRWSRLRAVRIGRRARPSLPWWARLMLPVTAYAVRLGRAHFGRRVIASMEDQTLVLAAPRTGKSGWLADRIIDHPGAVVTTTTRTDLFENTALLRGQHGVLHVFNPEGIGGLPSTFRWNPLQGCEQPAIALQRAVAFTAATESKGLHDMAFWIGKASSVLASLLHAAALDGPHHGRRLPVGARHRRRRTRADPVRPSRRGRGLARPDPGDPQARPDRRLDPHDGDPRAGLARRPRRRGGDLARPGRGLRRRRVRVRAQHPLHDRHRPGRGADRAAVPRVRRVRARRAAFVGSLQPHGRLDPPMLMALDEVTQICPVPLPLWMADSAGKGILIVAVCHGLAQLEARWDSAGARAIWDTAGIKVILGGVSRPRHPRPAVPAVRRDRAAHAQPDPGRRRAAGPHRHLPAGPGAAARTAADPARMAGAGPAGQPVPRRRPAADGLAAARLPARPPDRLGAADAARLPTSRRHAGRDQRMEHPLTRPSELGSQLARDERADGIAHDPGLQAG